MKRIVFCGDFATLNNRTSFLEIPKGDGHLICANLEGPITKRDEIAIKAGPNLKITPSQLSLLKDNLVILSLANNHIMDYGEQGLLDTIEACRKANVQTVGAGVNLASAYTPALLELEGVSIGVIGCCETQFGIATEWRAGVYPICPKIYRQIRELQECVDIVIISIHGASEDSPWPSPGWQELLRSFIDAGANIVHGHHSHVPQGYEEYNDGLIFYGLGNFVVDPKTWKDKPNTLWSIVPEINVANEKLKYQINTSVISEDDDNSILVRCSDTGEFKKHQKYLEICNKPLNDKKLLIALWQEVSIRMYCLVNAKWLGFRPETVRIRVKGNLRNFMRGMYKSFLACSHGQGVSASQDDLLLWYVLFACESHRDSIATALGVLSSELEDMRTDETRALADEMMPWSCNWRKNMI